MCSLNSSKLSYFVGKVSSIAQVEAVGYGLVELNVRVEDLYPDGGMQSAPVKNARIVIRETGGISAN